jgi:polyisoprenoid-binding protein YceI
MNPLTPINASAVNKAFLVVVLLSAHVGRAEDGSEFRVFDGTVKFVAVTNTNVSLLTVQGQSRQMTGSLMLVKGERRVELQSIRARIDPKSFKTGMSLRDEHMRRKVFSLANDTMPELEFVSDRITCPELPPGRDAACPVSGQLRLRGVTRPFAINLKVLNDGKGYRITAEGGLKLSDFGIEPPCQLGVCVTDDVKLSLEFQARETSSLAGGPR